MDSEVSDTDAHQPGHYSGFVGIVGRPNAGKSTLFNQLLGQKLSIITHKAQTTRHRIQGFYSDDQYQIVFLDTPGIIQPGYLLQEKMMEQVTRLRTDADLLLHLVDGRWIPEEDDVVFETLEALSLPSVLVVNKLDLAGKEKAQEVLSAYSRKNRYIEHVMISALDGSGVSDLLQTIKKYLPEGPAYFDKDQASDLPIRFFVSELIREQLFLLYQQEIPYSCAVNVVDFQEEDGKDYIQAEIVVNRNSQKGILIGKKGSKLKELGINSRQAISQFTGRKTDLRLFVKVRDKWREKESFLKSYGYK